MTAKIRRYLLWYVTRRRMIAIFCAAGWLLAFMIAWTILVSQLQRWFLFPPMLRRSTSVIGIAISIAIVARPILFLFRRANSVAAAIEIESRNSAFDQRLITVASSPNDSDLLHQLIGDVEQTIAENPARVSIRPALAPALAVLAAGLLLVWMIEADKTRPSGPSLNAIRQVWTFNPR